MVCSKVKKEDLKKVKELLNVYSIDKKTIGDKREHIKNINNQLITIKTCLDEKECLNNGNLDNENKINELIDKKINLEKDIKNIEKKYILLEEAINNLDDCKKEIIENIWVYHYFTIREQAENMYLSKSAVHKRSEQGISDIYEYMSNKKINLD